MIPISSRRSCTSKSGTTMLLVLPATTEPPHDDTTQRQDTEPARELPGRKLLLVEDNEELGLATARMLTLFGYEVTRVDNAEAAIELIDSRSQPFDVVLSDIVMPGGMSGVNFARYLKAHFPQLPVVLITGYASQLQEAREFRVLHKPCDPAQLAAALREAAAQAVTS